MKYLLEKLTEVFLMKHLINEKKPNYYFYLINKLLLVSCKRHTALQSL